MGFTVCSDCEQDFTHISNNFILEIMPGANGNYVKLYLYLQMLCQHPDLCQNVTVSKLADGMECTENDILRALRYWKKQGLVNWTEQEGEIQTIRLLTTASATTAETAAALETVSAPDAVLEPVHYTPPEKQTYTPLQAEALRNDIEIDKAIRQVEKLLCEPVSPAHLQLILYFMCDIGFSANLLVTLYETALHKGKKKPNYIEAIGISWAKQGIHTPEEARAEAKAFNGRYALVTRTLGIKDTLAPVNLEIIDSWDSYHFDDSIIEEACKRAALKTGGGIDGLHYTSGILKKWSSQQIKTFEDIEKNDASYKHQKKNTVQKPAPGKNQFQNFPQRVYSQSEYSTLERQLLRK